MAVNKENLISMAERTDEERRKYGRKGGIASGEARKRKKTLRETLQVALEEIITNAAGEKATMREVAMLQLATKMAKGDLKAIHEGAALLGELKQELSLDGGTDGMTIVVKNNDERAKLENMGDLG